MSDIIFTGTLRQWNKDKHFGLIGRKKGKADIFIHMSELRDLSRKPKVGDRISYQVIESKKGQIQAINGYIKGVSKYEQVAVDTEADTGTQKLTIMVAVIFSILAIYSIVKQVMA